MEALELLHVAEAMEPVLEQEMREQEDMPDQLAYAPASAGRMMGKVLNVLIEIGRAGYPFICVALIIIPIGEEGNPYDAIPFAISACIAAPMPFLYPRWKGVWRRAFGKLIQIMIALATLFFVYLILSGRGLIYL